MKQFKPISINGKVLEEGYVMNKWLESRFRRNKNAIIPVVGATGSGKSYGSIRMMEMWYKYKFNRPFPSENICFSISQTVKRIKQGGLERGEFIIVEEGGVVANALDFQNKIVKFFNFVLQSFRSKNIGIIFTLPSIGLLNKTARTLAHAILETKYIDESTKMLVFKPFYCQTNPMTGKVYNKYFRQRVQGRLVKVERISYGLPSKEILKPYEERKDKFVETQMDNLIELTEDEDNNNKYEEIDARIDDLISRGITKQVDIAEELGMTRQGVSKHFQRRWKKARIVPKSPEILVLSTDKPHLAPIST